MDDQELLREFTRNQSQEAFTALVHRHLNLVYWAALRQVRSSQLAEEVAQSVFSDLARSAASLKPGIILTAWLYQVTRRTAINVVRSEVRRQRREQISFEMNALHPPSADWKQIEPLLDEAMDRLDDHERTAVLLRYFENKSMREVGQLLGTSEAAAQKRVSRAVERLREFFRKDGVNVGASGLVLLISAEAVQAAPAGLGVAISTTTMAAGTMMPAAVTTTVTKAIVMTATQKFAAVATLAIAVGTGIYQTSRNAALEGQVENLQKRGATQDTLMELLNRERNDAVTTLGKLQSENERLQQATLELPKIRTELAQLKAARKESGQLEASAMVANDPFRQSVLDLTTKAVQLHQHLEQRPDRKIPELQLLTENDWLIAAKEAKFDTEADIRKGLSQLRSLAKSRLPLAGALNAYLNENQGQIPADLSELKPHLKVPLDQVALDSILQRYKLLQTGSFHNLPSSTWLVAEKAPVDKEYDSRAKFGNGTSTVIGTGLGSAGDPEDKSY